VSSDFKGVFPPPKLGLICVLHLTHPVCGSRPKIGDESNICMGGSSEKEQREINGSGIKIIETLGP
jgi:hypothetical protein